MTKQAREVRPYVRFSDRVWRLICQRIANGASVTQACKGRNVCTPAAVYQWLARWRASDDAGDRARLDAYDDAVAKRKHRAMLHGCAARHLRVGVGAVEALRLDADELERVARGEYAIVQQIRERLYASV